VPGASTYAVPVSPRLVISAWGGITAPGAASPHLSRSGPMAALPHQLAQGERSGVRGHRAPASASLGLLVDRHRSSPPLVFTADNDTAYAVAREHLVMPLTCDIGRGERDAAPDDSAAARFGNGSKKMTAPVGTPVTELRRLWR
jgi:hypothetical protein